MKTSGHLSRYHTIQITITDEDVSEQLHTDYRLDNKLLDELKEINKQLSKLRIETINRPSNEIMNPIYDKLEELIKDELKDRSGVELSDVINVRLKDDIIRELVAHALLRRSHQNYFNTISNLEYTQEDVDFILDRLPHFYEFIVAPLIAGDFTNSSKKSSKIIDCMKLIIDFLADGTIKSRKEIVDHLNKDMDVCVATIDNALKKLLEEEKIISVSHGHYRKK